MPNIKIYGVVERNLNYLPDSEKAKKLSKKIRKIFNNKSYAEHIVITYIYSEVKDLEEQKQPYIQLELDCMKNYEEQVKLLKTLGYDIQVVKLHAFIPKE